MEENAKIIIDERYSGHKMKISKAGINMKSFTTLMELWENTDKWGKKKKKT